MRNILIIIVLSFLVILGFKYLNPNTATIDGITDSTADELNNATSEPIDFDDIAPTYVDLSPISTSTLQSVPQVITSSSFTCDGRQHCSQMTSCAEATYFNNNCPNTKMDGNNDGVPCESQWCQ